MDNPGWHAQRRAQRESQIYLQRPDGNYGQDNEISPMHENFIGGLNVSHPPPPPAPPALPPKDYIYTQPGYHIQQPSVTSSRLTHMTAVERSQTLRVARMDPHLQFMVGPLLRYDTVDDEGIWHGAALIVTADSSSIYEPHPILTYSWDPDKPQHGSTRQMTRSFDLGPHPADPHSVVLPTSPPLAASGFVYNGNGTHKEVVGPNAKSDMVPGHEFYVYGGNGGTFTFWRFLIQIPLTQHQMAITYNINSGQELEFFVPGRWENMRWATYSCNGFSAGINPDDFRGPGFKSGYDPVWIDLLAKHAEKPFHVLVGGGDQLYCDSLMREPEMQSWVSKKPEEKKTLPLTEEIALAIDRFYFNHYCQSFRRGAFARANSSIPMINMADDHDLIDGFGSYPEDLQMAPVFRTIGSRGYFFFLLFQCFINPEVDGTSDTPGRHVNKSIIIGGQGPYIHYPSHSFLSYLGPQCYILLLDCRAERKKDQVCSSIQYRKVFERLKRLPEPVEHVVVQLGIPIAYPRMVFLERALDSKFNPLVALGKTGTLGLSGFVNKFNAEAELLDDLNDHWTARNHKEERNWLIERLQLFSRSQRIRVTFLSGDVHCAAVGILKTLKSKNHKIELAPAVDHRYMINVVTSAIVNTPPPVGVITMVSSLASKIHKTLHNIETDETMLPLFDKEPNGSTRKQKFIMGRRNWCSVDWNLGSGNLIFDIHVEREKGLGKTTGYPVSVPPPAWPRGS